MSDAHSVNDKISKRATQPKEIEVASESSLAGFFRAIVQFYLVLFRALFFFVGIVLRRHYAARKTRKFLDILFFVVKRDPQKKLANKTSPPPNSHYKLNLFQRDIFRE